MTLQKDLIANDSQRDHENTGFVYARPALDAYGNQQNSNPVAWPGKAPSYRFQNPTNCKAGRVGEGGGQQAPIKILPPLIDACDILIHNGEV